MDRLDQAQEALDKQYALIVPPSDELKVTKTNQQDDTVIVGTAAAQRQWIVKILASLVAAAKHAALGLDDEEEAGPATERRKDTRLPSVVSSRPMYTRPLARRSPFALKVF